MSKNNTTLAFFYGTLRKGWWNNPRCISKDSKLISTGKTKELFRMFVQSNIPCILKDDKGYPIFGEVWELSQNDARDVERLEYGYSSIETPITLTNGKTVKAKLYYSAGDEMPAYFTGKQIEVTSGDFEDAVKKTN